MICHTRRDFLKTTLGSTAAALAALPCCTSPVSAAPKRGDKMAFGLVTYLWGRDWDLPTLIANCEKARSLGVELRTTHAHGVETSLNPQQRAEIKRRFADSPVTLVGLGSNERFDHPDAAQLEKAVETTKQFVVLSHDVGSSGVKVKPNSFHRGVPRETTIEQIGRALNQVGKFAADYDQQIRLEHDICF